LHRNQQNSYQVLEVVLVDNTHAHLKSFAKLRPKANVFLQVILMLSNEKIILVSVAGQMDAHKISSSKLFAIDNAIYILRQQPAFANDPFFV